VTAGVDRAALGPAGLDRLNFGQLLVPKRNFGRFMLPADGRAPHRHRQKKLAVRRPPCRRRAQPILYSVIVSCLRHGVEPLAYLRDVLTRLPAMTNQDYLALILPSNWRPGRSSRFVIVRQAGDHLGHHYNRQAHRNGDDYEASRLIPPSRRSQGGRLTATSLMAQ
jgi:hypothetical protein